MRFKQLYIFLLFLSFLSCKGDEEYIYPPVKLEFITAHVDNSGNVAYLKTDKDTIYQVVKDRTSKKMDINTDQRVVCYYSLSKEATSTRYVADIYSLLQTISPTPRTLSKGELIKTDPVGIQSIWLSGKYINLTLQIKAQNGSHYFHFIEEAIEQNEGHPLIHLTLYHDKNGDVEAYTKIAYLSIPLSTYINQYSDGFSVAVSVNTYTEGIEEYTFNYIPS